MKINNAGMNSLYAGAMVTITAIAGCQGGGGGGRDWAIERRDPSTVTDYDYRFDEDDAREISQWMSADALSKPWIDEWRVANGGARPLVVVGNIKNNTEDYINSGIFTDPMERELLNSGKVRLKAQKDLRPGLREERLDTEFNDPKTVKAAAMEVNADFMLVGSIDDQKERSRSGRAIISFYQVDLEMINLETAEKVWIGTKGIEKKATR